MSLPKFDRARKSIDVEGEVVLIRSLTRKEVAQAQQLQKAAGVEEGGDWSELEIFVIACGTDTPVEEAREWVAATDNSIVPIISDAIRELSRIDEEAHKSD
jgi:hypothetical protein